MKDSKVYFLFVEALIGDNGFQSMLVVEREQYADNKVN